MGLVAKVALGVGVSVAVWCAVAYAAGGDEQRYFIHGSERASELPRKLFVGLCDEEVEAEYTDDDDVRDGNQQKEEHSLFVSALRTLQSKSSKESREDNTDSKRDSPEEELHDVIAKRIKTLHRHLNDENNCVGKQI